MPARPASFCAALPGSSRPQERSGRTPPTPPPLPHPDFGKELPYHDCWQDVESFGDGLGTDLQRGHPQQAFSGQDFLYFGDGWDPTPHEAHDNRHHHGQREEPLPHTDDPLRLPRIAPLQLAWSEDGWTEQVCQTLFYLCHRWQWDL